MSRNQDPGTKHCCTDLVFAPALARATWQPLEKSQNCMFEAYVYTKFENVMCPTEKDLLPGINALGLLNSGTSKGFNILFHRLRLRLVKKITNTGNNSLCLHVLNFPIHFHYLVHFRYEKQVGRQMK